MNLLMKVALICAMRERYARLALDRHIEEEARYDEFVVRLNKQIVRF